jgi:hypothetical protein
LPITVQLGYAAQVALWYAVTLPGWSAYLLGEGKREETVGQYGRSAEEIAAGWPTLWEYAQERADELPLLLQQLGVE